jgi:GR25 family glycosyltransferase involved in LPS biosynthesis
MEDSGPLKIFEIFVINLDSRPDRMFRMKEQLPNSFTRVPAIDGTKGDIVAEHQALTSATNLAIWLSHVKAYETFLATDFKYALIVEDDADFQSVENLELELIKWVDLLETEKLNVLQIGTMGDFRIRSRFKNFMHKLISPYSDQVRKRYPNLVFNSFAPGAHAYFVDKKAAKLISRLNSPAYLPSDGVLMYLAGAQQAYGKLRMARLRPTKVVQFEVNEFNATNNENSPSGK